MFTKILVPILFLLTQIVFTAYGYFLGKLPTSGSFFGYTYDSVVISSLVQQLKFFWIIFLANTMFVIAFNLGLGSYKHYLIIATFSVIATPIAAILFNMVVTKEPFTWPILIGLIFIIIGSILVVGHEEILKIF